MFLLAKKRPLSTMLFVLVLTVVAKWSLFIYDSYWYDGSGLLYIIVFLLTIMIYGVLVICLAMTVIGFVRKRLKTILFTLSWLIVSILNQTFDQHSYTLDALLAVRRAGPESVLYDTLELADKYPSPTCIGGLPGRYPCEHPLDINILPMSILVVRPSSVVIDKEYVLLEKAGLEGVFRGFIVFRDGFDPWSMEDDVLLQTECNNCWRIRIANGMYWYHETSDFPIKFVPPSIN